MPDLIIKYSDRPDDKFRLARLRTTIGRSARSDICIPDPFASRLHAEIRQEGDSYWLHDLGSANGTRYNGSMVSMPVPMLSGGEIQIGETVIVFQDGRPSPEKSATLISDNTQALNPAMTIALSPLKSATAEILEAQPGGSTRNGLLTLISKVGIALLGSTSFEETLQMLASLVFEAVPAERCVIMLRDDDNPDKLKIEVAKMRGSDEALQEVRISRTVMEEVTKNGKSVLTSDAQHDPRYASQTMALLGIRSVLAVPLSVGTEVFGLIYADSPTYEASFTEEHLNILTTLASVASIRVENARLTEERFERERLEHELKLASEIQQRLQPSSPPVVEGYDLQGVSFSCYEVGGDYYDFIPRCDGKLLVALGDVSGKGTAAALLMSSLHAAMHAQVAANSSLLETINAVNQYLAKNTPTNRFVTLFLAELDAESGAMNFINAGHNPPLIAHADGRIEQLASGGFPLGIMPMAQYDVGQTRLQKGEALVIYSDGVSEANNTKGEEFGVERLEEVVKKHLSASAAGLRDKVESALSSFTQTAPAGDDITLVIVKRKS
ncbi:MAG TPA: SpoIIE family protein phosphatase [Pyrinomonadaceae bacterium]|jgi:serine phosphatase RsbU (regulator of sigma subunit)/pSer/pThr/pTyr-binding forkhead associated (FHA) protein